MDTYLIVLRIFHIGTGAFWAGAAIYQAVFLLPAAKALGPDGGKFMQQLSVTNKFPIVFLANGTLNILTGILLIWHQSQGFSNDFMGSHMGIVLSIGGTLAIIAYLIGIFVNRPTIGKISAIAREAAMKQQPPTAEQVQQLAKLRQTLTTATNAMAWIIVGTVIAMAIARYV